MKNYIIYFQTNSVCVYQLVNKKPVLKKQQQLFFNETIVHDEMPNKIRNFLDGFKQEFGVLDNKSVEFLLLAFFRRFQKKNKHKFGWMFLLGLVLCLMLLTYL